MNKAKVIADGFAEMWYRRPDSGCDEMTLAILLEGLLRKVQEDARRVEFERVGNRLRDVLGP